MAGKYGGLPAEKYAGLGLQFVVAILLFAYLGSVLDRYFGTRPVLMIVGVFVGAGASFYSMYRKVMADTHGPKR